MMHPLHELPRRTLFASALALLLMILSIGLATDSGLALRDAQAQDLGPAQDAKSAQKVESVQDTESAPAPSSWEELGLRDWGLAPEISLEAADGSGTVKLSELVKEGPVLVDFWATWCGPCRMAMPQYVTLYESYNDRGFSVLAVSQDSPQVLDKVLDFSIKMGLPFPVVMDSEKKAGAQYQVRSLPTSYLVDQRGHVVSGEIGYRPGSEKHLAKQIEALLAAGQGPGVEG